MSVLRETCQIDIDIIWYYDNTWDYVYWKKPYYSIMVYLFITTMKLIIYVDINILGDDLKHFRQSCFYKNKNKLSDPK